MDRRFLLWIILVFILLFIYQLFFYKPPPPKEVQKKEKIEVKEKSVALAPVELDSLLDSGVVVVETPLEKAVFTKRGAVLIHYYLKKYRDSEGKLLDLVPQGGYLFDVTADSVSLTREVFDTEKDTFLLLDGEGSIKFRARNISFVKEFIFRPDKYFLDFKAEGNAKMLTLYFAGVAPTEKNRKEELKHLNFITLNGGLKRIKLKKGIKRLGGDFTYFGVKTKYFFLSVIPERGEIVEIRAERRGEVIPFEADIRGGKAELKVYFGPIDWFLLKKLGYGLDKVYSFGFAIFAPFAKAILYIFAFLHKFIPNYGLVIIVFAILMKLVFWPFTIKSLRSMRKMQELKPKIDALRKIYKDDPQRMQKEMMELYKQYKVNPFSGCLILLLQLPIFWGLYQILKTTIYLRHAPFILWIRDLSTYDPYFILPILMGAASLGQALMQPAQDKQSRLFALFMPVFLTVIFLKFPAGIVLYWLIYSLLGIVEQFVLKRQKTEG